MEINKAVRKAAPLLISTSGVSGSGKTFSSILLAAGLAGANGRVCLVDTENGRGSMYADDPDIMKALPNGYETIQMDPDFSPRRYIECINTAEKAGVSVLVFDSASHEWEGIGGCTEIAEKNKLKGMPNWSLAKIEHKRFVNHCLSTNMHLVFCLRAREKTRIVKNASGKEEFINDGIQPIAEKNFVFEMTVSLLLEDKTHFANPIKVPRALLDVFPGGTLLTKEAGERLRQWNSAGKVLEPAEQLRKRAFAAAESGVEGYRQFFQGLSVIQRKMIEAEHAANKKTAEQVDSVPTFGSKEEPVEFPDSFDGPAMVWNGEHLVWNEQAGNYQSTEKKV